MGPSISLLLSGLLGGILAAQPVAMVMDLRGTVRAEGNPNPLRLLAELDPGHPLSLEKGASLVLVTLPAGEEIRVEGPARFTLDATGRPQGRVKARVERARALQLKSRLKPAGLAQAGVMMKEVALEDLVGRNGHPTPALRTPASKVLREARPAFAWSPIPEATWTFVLKDGQGSECLRFEGPGTGALLPEGASLRAGAVYTWSLEARFADGSRTQATGELHRLDGAREASLRRLEAPATPFARRLLRAVLLEQYGLEDEAREAWRRLQEERPGEPALRTAASRVP